MKRMYIDLETWEIDGGGVKRVKGSGTVRGKMR